MIILARSLPLGEFQKLKLFSTRHGKLKRDIQARGLLAFANTLDYTAVVFRNANRITDMYLGSSRNLIPPQSSAFALSPLLVSWPFSIEG